MQYAPSAGCLPSPLSERSKRLVKCHLRQQRAKRNAETDVGGAGEAGEEGKEGRREEKEGEEQGKDEEEDGWKRKERIGTRRRGGGDEKVR